MDIDVFPRSEFKVLVLVKTKDNKNNFYGFLYPGPMNKTRLFQKLSKLARAGEAVLLGTLDKTVSNYGGNRSIGVLSEKTKGYMSGNKGFCIVFEGNISTYLEGTTTVTQMDIDKQEERFLFEYSIFNNKEKLWK